MTPAMRSRALVAAAALTWGACGGAGAPTTTPPPLPGVLQVAGTYQIVQRAVSTTCGDSGTPIPVTGTVTHAPGGDTFVLADTGGTTFNGAVRPNGDFTANAVFGPDARGNTFTQRLAGRFTASGFTARLEVDVSPQACAFTREWSATKQGAPNVFP
jgi:hypothetical protein